jgi:hypothetical protein
MWDRKMALRASAFRGLYGSRKNLTDTRQIDQPYLFGAAGARKLCAPAIKPAASFGEAVP